MFEVLGGSLIYSLVKDAWALVRGRRRRPKTSDIIQTRQKWKAEIEEKLWEFKKKQTRRDVIIRDVKRVNQYPDIDERSKGISPWFKVGLMGTYHRGILAGLSWEQLTRDAQTGQFRSIDWHRDEKEGFRAILIGYIPYENIEAID